MDLWLAVAKMETAGFTSELYRRAYNPWGMRQAKVRTHTQTWVISTANGIFAAYSTLDNAARDIIHYMDSVGFPESVDGLRTFIQILKAKGYFVEPADFYYDLVAKWRSR